MNIKTISVAKQFGIKPYGRDEGHGQFNGQRFRHELLLPALNSSEKIIVDLNGVLGYHASFLEEAFGGVVRLGYFNAQDLLAKLEFRYKSNGTIVLIEKYIRDAIFDCDKEFRVSMEERYKRQPHA